MNPGESANPEKIKVIMANGLIASGKDTLADTLVKYKGYEKFSLATVLKEFTSKKYGFNEQLCYTQKGKNIVIPWAYRSVRQLLIIESEKAKENDAYFFANACIKSILSSGCKKIVISDFRFPEEYHRFKEVFADVRTVKVVRPGNVVQDFASEHQLDDFVFDLEIMNDSTLENFEEKIISNNFF